VSLESMVVRLYWRRSTGFTWASDGTAVFVGGGGCGGVEAHRPCSTTTFTPPKALLHILDVESVHRAAKYLDGRGGPDIGVRKHTKVPLVTESITAAVQVPRELSFVPRCYSCRRDWHLPRFLPHVGRSVRVSLKRPEVHAS